MMAIQQKKIAQAPPIWMPGQIWKGQTVVLLASGPSLSDEQLAYVKGKALTIAINTTYKAAPWATMLYACDLKWWNWHDGAFDFEGLRVTTDVDAANLYDIAYIPGIPEPGLSTDPCAIHTGSNSGYQAINLAALLGAKRVLLLGYDMKIAKNGASHWHGDHPDKQRSPYQLFLDCFDTIAEQNPDIEIINCTPGSALDCFDKSTIETMI